MRDTREILTDIDHTRDEMDRTLRELEQRFTPRHLTDQAIDYLKNSGAREYATNLGSSIKTNPLPATLTGIGLAWLMAVGNRPPQPSYESSSAGGMMDNVKGKASDLRQRASSLGSSAREQASRMRNSWDSVTNEHPLALGAIGLAIGALCAAMAPRSQKEEELVGKVKEYAAPPAGQKSDGQKDPSMEPETADLPPDPTLWPASTRSVS